MATTRPLPAAAPAVSATPSTPSASPAPLGAPPGTSAPASRPAPVNGPPRHRLRAVAPDEVVTVADLLPPGATWLPAPQHSLPALPGHPPMVGYLVLVPADRRPPFPVAVPGPGTPRHPDTAPAAAPGTAVGTATAAQRIRVDTAQRTAEVDGRRLDLTYLEFELLAHLVAHPNRVHTRDHLVATVWGYGHVGDGRTVDVHIARLRRKLGAEHRGTIQTVRRVGYKYAP
ncbi:winged helix-turn-helix domain-containing protein [Streptomyces prasinopilosus]|uniref:Transcriptional regulatory protein, C terminal n=1 Tax=Streptomyces prasinopilosus TaxID=67344 RepID=A0A1G6JQR0_9ACTN|nr:winged helix-turn-helix domain-containing protein [Streptomyces prasinopilosus]SDC21033.1 Transcriptional regulatory protein, C terminal [Streptomyces prasinopilosus]